MGVIPFQKWHEDYSLFRKVSVYLLTGLELYQKGKYVAFYVTKILIGQDTVIY